MTLQIYDDIQQGSEAWFRLRAGLPTASEFKTLLGIKKDAREKVTRRTYMMKLAGEIITGEPMESYSNSHMERGREREDEAREKYAFIHDADIRRVGFIRNGNKGASPDSLIGEDGGLEIKDALPHVQIDRLLKGEMPPEHKAQVQGNMWVAEREWWDFVSHCRGLPMLTVTVCRDEAYIRQIVEAVDTFNDELAELVERIRAYDAPRDETREILKNKFVQSVMAG